MDRVDVEPTLLRWARERAGLRVDALVGRFPRIEAWERGEAQPTLKQLERFAKATYTPVGYLFLREPPVERIPIADFRAGTGSNRGRPSANLLDTIYLCQQRQNWYREFAQTAGEGSIGFVGSASTEDDVPEIAARIRRLGGFEVEERRRCRTWVDALREFVGRVESLGVLVLASGVVGSNSRRKLDAREFRGFALADSIAPMTLGARVSRRFARAIVGSTLEGQTSFSESFRLLGLRKMETFNRLASNLGLLV